MVDICMHLHHPQLLRQLSIFDAENTANFADMFDEQKTRQSIVKNAHELYMPTNKRLLRHLSQQTNTTNVGIIVTGTTLQLLNQYAPEVIDSYKQLATHNRVHFITAPHHYTALNDDEETAHQIQQHQQLLTSLFNITPTIVTGTHGKSMTFPAQYTHTITAHQPFSHTAPTIAIHRDNQGKSNTVTCFDYHSLQHTSVLDAWQNALQQHTPTAYIPTQPVEQSELQHHAIQTALALKSAVYASNNPELINVWKHATAHDHIGPMNTASTPYIHHPYESAYEAYMTIMNICEVIAQRLNTQDIHPIHA